jgi:hypothetical protein
MGRFVSRVVDAGFWKGPHPSAIWLGILIAALAGSIVLPGLPGDGLPAWAKPTVAVVCLCGSVLDVFGILFTIPRATAGLVAPWLGVGLWLAAAASDTPSWAFSWLGPTVALIGLTVIVVGCWACARVVPLAAGPSVVAVTVVVWTTALDTPKPHWADDWAGWAITVICASIVSVAGTWAVVRVYPRLLGLCIAVIGFGICLGPSIAYKPDWAPNWSSWAVEALGVSVILAAVTVRLLMISPRFLGPCLSVIGVAIVLMPLFTTPPWYPAWAGSTLVGGFVVGVGVGATVGPRVLRAISAADPGTGNPQTSPLP